MASIPEQIKYLYGQVKCLSSQIEECCNQVFDFIPYTGADKTINLNTQQLLVGDITANSFIKSGDTDANILLAGGGVTALNLLALNSAVVHLTGNESISGIKTFTTSITTALISAPTDVLTLTTGAVSFVIDDTDNTIKALGADITAAAYIKEGGLATEFLKADGSVDNNVYALASAIPGTPTLQQVTNTGATTTNQIIVSNQVTATNLVTNGSGGGISLGHTENIAAIANTTTLVGDVNLLKIYSNNGVNPPKSISFDISGITAGFPKTYTMPDTSGTFALLSDLVLRHYNEGNGIGWAYSSDRTKYGNIGLDAFDFSYSNDPSSVMGATGESSFVAGIDNIGSGFNSTTFGYLNTNASVGGFMVATNSQSVGYVNNILGPGNNVTGTNITVVGQAAEIIAENPNSNNIGTSPVFIVGNGTITDNDPNYTVLTRSNAFVVRKNGAVEITNTLTVGGSIAFGFINKTASYVLTKDNRTIEVITASTQTLPTAVGISGREYRIINASTGNVIVDTTSSQTIGNKNTETRTSITLLPEEWLDVISNGSNWRII